MGFLAALFFLNLIHHLGVGEFSLEKAREMGLITFFNTNLERQLEAGAIIISLIFLGALIGRLIIVRRDARDIKMRIKLLEELDKMRTEFIWMASHQLRTPLSALKWSINMLLEGSYGRLNKEQQDILTDARAANERLVILTDELLNVSQIESGRLQVNLKPISLSEFQKAIEQKVKELKILADNKNLFLNIESSLPFLPQARVKADVFRIQQIIQSLLENAIWYTFPGKNIKVKIAIMNNEVAVQIIDEGIGIPQEEQSGVFSKFFRASNARKIRSSSTGLGLYICKMFIEEHGGKIGFMSQENKGSTFSFSLPLETGKPAEEFLKKL